jgi:hypothetical protein
LDYHHLHLDDPPIPSGQAPASEQQVMGAILKAMGHDDPSQVQILKKEKGALRELTTEETEKLIDQGPPKKKRSQ